MVKFINNLMIVFRKPSFREIQQKYNSIYLNQPKPESSNVGLALGLQRHIERLR